jgi:DNA invertase Pin-like site-specific DNA recombinase
MKCRLVAYYRVSTEKQGASGLGLEAQEAAVKAHVASTGCELIASYTEVESGRKSDRPKLIAAIAHAKRARATLVIAKMDRLSRNVAFIANLLDSGVTFVACDSPHANKLTIHILAAVAEQEARAISQRTKDALAIAKVKGTKSGVPLGAAGKANLTREGTLKGSAAGVESIRRAKAEAYSFVRPIIADLHAEGLSLRAITARLNTMGETTRSGRPWNATQVRRVLAEA